MKTQNKYLIEQYKQLHEQNKGYGAGSTYMRRIGIHLAGMGCKTALDYGCGKGKLAEGLRKMGIDCDCYDPAVEEFSELPDGLYDGVIANDVLEHLTKDTITGVLKNIYHKARRVIFLNISCRPAVHKLPDGQQCHTLLMGRYEWEDLIKSYERSYSFNRVATDWNPNNRNLFIISEFIF